MLKLSITEIKDLIEKGKTFEAIASDDSFYLKIEELTPYVCAAIHDGHQLREELENKIKLNKLERWMEEDPLTGRMISSMPIVIIGRDSRYEYDLNRNPDKCIYDIAWGKKVWQTPLSDQQKYISKTKHNNFYQVAEKLIQKLQNKFEFCLVYDFHSFNYRRYNREVPLFNIGTVLVDQKKFIDYIKYWTTQLNKIILPGINTTVAVNDVFSGQGYFLEFISQRFKNTLVLATEIKKVYCDETSGDVYPLIIEALEKQIKTAILDNTLYFSKKLTNLKV